MAGRLRRRPVSYPRKGLTSPGGALPAAPIYPPAMKGPPMTAPKNRPDEGPIEAHLSRAEQSTAARRARQLRYEAVRAPALAAELITRTAERDHARGRAIAPGPDLEAMRRLHEEATERAARYRLALEAIVTQAAVPRAAFDNDRNVELGLRNVIAAAREVLAS